MTDEIDVEQWLPFLKEAAVVCGNECGRVFRVSIGFDGGDTPVRHHDVGKDYC